MCHHLPRTQTSLSLWKCARKGRREGDNRLYPSHGPLRFITSHSRFALASMMWTTQWRSDLQTWGVGAPPLPETACLRPGSAVWKESKWGEIGKISPSREEADFFSFCPQCRAWCQANLSPVQIPIVCSFYSFDNLSNPERLKLKFFCMALVLNLCKFPKFICLTDIEFEVI